MGVIAWASRAVCGWGSLDCCSRVSVCVCVCEEGERGRGCVGVIVWVGVGSVGEKGSVWVEQP